MTARHKFLRLLLVTVILIAASLPWWASPAPLAHADEPPIPLPAECGGFTGVGGTCCIYGYIYYNDTPQSGVNVRIESPYGSLDVITTAGPASDYAYYSADLSSPPLFVSPGDTITITASYGDMVSARTWTAQSDGQHVDLGLVAGYQAPGPASVLTADALKLTALQAPDQQSAVQEAIRHSEHRTTLQDQTNLPIKLTNVSLGKPGLSFRYVETFGVTEVAYLADTDHLNHSNGISIDGADNLWVAEWDGYRVLRYNSAGTFQMSIGTTGLRGVGEDSFAGPGDVGADPSGNIWVVDIQPHRVVKFDSSGNYLDQIGVDWEEGTDDDHLNSPLGIDFDDAGSIYISDNGNHRVQIFDSSGVYSATLGVSGISGSDNSHFNHPDGLAVDSSRNIYVADEGNHRVQIFDSTGVYSATLGATTCGTANNQFCYPSDVAVDSSGNIYVADSENHRVQVFDSSLNYIATLGQTGTSGSDNAYFNFPEGVAVDSNGNIYVSDWHNYRVQKFSSGRIYQATIGTTGVPYLTDNDHFNAPYGITVDGSGNIILTEESGHRLLKLNGSGTPQWSVGEAGVAGYDYDNSHFARPRGVAVDGSGQIYVADANQNRVQIFSSSGTYVATLGSYGSGNYQFDWAADVAVDQSGYIYVADTNNHRIQVFDSNRLYVATLGITGVSGSDNSHFSYPNGVAVDTNGNIYVADTDNHRVQVFDSNRVYQRTIGSGGGCDDAFDRFCEPHDVAVDASGRIYIADRYNQRVQVFDSNGAYLTTIGGEWGNGTGQFREPCSVEVDAEGNIYVADWGNHRIQKFAPGVPGWEQTNINGFGDRQSMISTLDVFNSQMYAGIWRNDDSQAPGLAHRRWADVEPGHAFLVGLQHGSL